MEIIETCPRAKSSGFLRRALRLVIQDREVLVVADGAVADVFVIERVFIAFGHAGGVVRVAVDPDLEFAGGNINHEVLAGVVEDVLEDDFVGVAEVDDFFATAVVERAFIKCFVHAVAVEIEDVAGGREIRRVDFLPVLASWKVQMASDFSGLGERMMPGRAASFEVA